MIKNLLFNRKKKNRNNWHRLLFLYNKFLSIKKKTYYLKKNWAQILNEYLTWHIFIIYFEFIKKLKNKIYQHQKLDRCFYILLTSNSLMN